KCYAQMEEAYSKSGWQYYIAISENGKEVVKFGIQREKNEIVGSLTTYEVDGNKVSQVSASSYTINANYIRGAPHSIMPTWSLAISNANKNGKILVALSYFPINGKTPENDMDLESGRAPLQDPSSTYVLVMDRNSSDKWKRIGTSLDEVAGVVNVASDTDSDKWLLTVSNEGGIFKCNIDPEKKRHTRKYRTLDEAGVWFRDIPKAYRHNMKVKWKDLSSKACFQFLTRMIKSHTYVEPEPKKKRLRVYNLITGRHLFDLQHHGDPSLIGFDTPVLAISKNGTLLAVSLDTTSINIYLMENGLECGRKDVSKLYRIILIEFINNDECLLIIRESRKTGELEATVWELFTCRKDRGIKINLPNGFFHERPNLYGVRWAGNTTLFVTDEGELKSVLDHFDPEKGEVNGGEDSPIVADRQLEYSKAYELNGKIHELPDSKFTQLIICRIEPWMTDGNQIIGAWLDENKEGESRKQLLIGRDSIQIWERLSDHKFDLTIKREDVLHIVWPIDPSKVVVDACKALEWLDRKKNENQLHENQSHERRILFDEIKHRVTNMVYIFIKEHPDEWRLLEVRHDLMSSLIIGGCYRLTHDLLKVNDGESEDEHNCRPLHIPREYSWLNDDGKRKKTDIEVAIETNVELAEDLLTYYAHHAKTHCGWMCTAGGALLSPKPKSSKGCTVRGALKKVCEFFNPKPSKVDDLDILRKRFLAHPTFAGHSFHHHQHPSASYTTIFRSLPNIRDDLERLTEIDVIANQRHAHLTTALKFRLFADQWMRRVQHIKLAKFISAPFSFVLKRVGAMFDRVRDPETRINTVRRVPVPVNDDGIVPILEKAVNAENNEIFFDNPVISGLINYAWDDASRLYFIFLFVFFCYLIIFDVFVWQYIHQNNSHYAIVVCFLAIGVYYAMFQMRAMVRHQQRVLFFSVINICSAALPITTAVVLTSRATRGENGAWGFGQTEIDRGILFLISMSTFIMWFQLLLLLRPFEAIGSYVFIISNIISHILPFLTSLFILVVAFGHAMYVLLHDPTQIGLSPNVLRLGVNTTTSNGGVEQTNYTVYQNYNPQDVSDNSFATLWTSVLSSYNWMNGRWDNVDWNYYPVIIFTVIASLLLVIIMLNILIAIMADIYAAAKVFGKREILRLRARFVLDAENFEYFGFRKRRTSRFQDAVKRNPRYMYVLGNRQQFEQWVEEGKKFRELTKPQEVQEKLTDHSWFRLEDNDSSLNNS
ncbi:6480_t:CDS:2, partial [Paraglomus occultum]